MRAPGLVVRLALRDARRDVARLSLCAVLVGLAVAGGVAALGTTSGGSAANLRVEAQRTGGSVVAPPSIRYWDRRRLVLRGGGRELQIDRSRRSMYEVQATPASGAAVTLPRGSAISAFGAASERIVGHRRIVSAVVVDSDLAKGPAAAATHVEQGRAPVSAGEVALDRDLANRLDVGLGNTVEDGARKLRVVGMLSRPLKLASDRIGEAVLAPGALSTRHGGWAEWLVHVPDRYNLLSPGMYGGGATFGARVEGDPPARAYGSTGDLVATGVVQAFGLIIPLFIVGAVLATGIERRVRERALLALAGAGPAVLRELEALRGAIIGLGGAVVGVVLAVAYAAIAEREVVLTPGAVLVPGGVAVVVSAFSVALASQTARVRHHAVGSVPGLPPWWVVRRELLRGGGLLAAGLVVVVVGAWFGELAGAIGALVAAIAALIALSLLGPAVVVLPALLPLPTALRAATQGAARARWVSGPAATAYAIATIFLIFALLGASGQLGSGDSGIRAERGDPHLAAIRASTLIDAQGRLAAPASTVQAVAATLPDARLVPVQPAWHRSTRFNTRSAMQDGRLYVADNAELARLGVQPGLLRGRRVLVLGEAADGGPTEFDPIGPVMVGKFALPIVRAVPDWPPSLPHLFIDRATAARAGMSVGRTSTYVIASSATIEAGRASSLRATAERAGLAVSTADDALGDRHLDRLDERERLAFAAAELALTLLFGSVATALVLVELRGESRLLLLVGARPRDHRLRAAAVAFTLGAAAVFMVAIGVVFLAGMAAVFGSALSTLDAVVPSLLPLAVAPFLLALAAGLAFRPAIRIGRIGRVPRDAATSLR